MATGDKNILAFANLDSLQHKQSRTYGAGSICIKDGLFREANGDIPENTIFAEGDTGATWKTVGGKTTEDWITGTEYKAGDEVYQSAATWVAATDHTAATSFETDLFTNKWDLKSGLLNEQSLEYTPPVTVGGLDYITPSEPFGMQMGTVTKPFGALRTEYVTFCVDVDGTPVYMGNIDADSDSLGIFAENTDTVGENNRVLRLGARNNRADIELSDTKIEIKNDVEIKDPTSLKFLDGDEEWIRLTFNDNSLRFIGALNSVEYTVDVMNLTYDGDVSFRGTVESGADINLNGDIISSSTNLRIGSAGGADFFFSGGGDFRPVTNDARNIGSSSNKLDNIYATNGTIVTSDEREKDFIEFPEELLDVWFDYVKPLSYKWNSAVEKKGDKARKHFGYSAQDIIKAFLAAGLDWTKYGVVSADFFDEDSDTNIVPEDFDYKDIDNLPPLMVRYPQAQVIESAAIRKKIGI